ncbi:protein of unknown function [Xenorhabdus bovienii]|uniref:Uncharacterized protein n=1 Tax=Xenorhabdus bovienii TaxID=40576 RepID=A0A0B6X948_XENBV|nr:protein of unknown function [Xenorhabdus bovienii]
MVMTNYHFLMVTSYTPLFTLINKLCGLLF